MPALDEWSVAKQYSSANLNLGSNNSSGFSAIYAGSRKSEGWFDFYSNNTVSWSSTSYSNNTNVSLKVNHDYVGFTEDSGNSSGFKVCCLKD